MRLEFPQSWSQKTSIANPFWKLALKMFLVQSTHVFSGVLCEIFRNTFIYRTPLVTKHPLQGKSMDWFLYNRDFCTSGILQHSHSENHLCWRVFGGKVAECVCNFTIEFCFPGSFPFFFLNRYLAKLCTAASAFTPSYVFPFLVQFLLKRKFMPQVLHMFFGILRWKAISWSGTQKFWFHDHIIQVISQEKIDKTYGIMFWETRTCVQLSYSHFYPPESYLSIFISQFESCRFV